MSLSTKRKWSMDSVATKVAAPSKRKRVIDAQTYIYALSVLVHEKCVTVFSWMDICDVVKMAGGCYYFCLPSSEHQVGLVIEEHDEESEAYAKKHGVYEYVYWGRNGDPVTVLTLEDFAHHLNMIAYEPF